MTRFRPHPSHDDAPDPKDKLDDALEALVRGDRRGLDTLDPEMRATVDQMYRWADESGFRNEPLPATTRRAWGGVRWRLVLSGLAAALLVGTILAATFFIVDLRQDDSAPERSYGSGNGDVVVLDGVEYLTVRGAEQDVYRVFGEYQWPDGYTPTPGEIVDHFSGGEDHEEREQEGLFTPGIGHGLVGNWHSCAWYMTWLDAYQSGDSELQEEALDVMANILPYQTSNTASAREHDEEIARRAALGDPSLVAQQVQGRCDRLSFAQGSEDNDGTSENGQWRPLIDQLDRFDDVDCFNVATSGEMTPCNADTPGDE